MPAPYKIRPHRSKRHEKRTRCSFLEQLEPRLLLTSGWTNPFYARDVNGDGYQDLVPHFDESATGLTPGDTEGCLRGNLKDGTSFKGCDLVNVF